MENNPTSSTAFNPFASFDAIAKANNTKKRMRTESGKHELTSIESATSAKQNAMVKFTFTHVLDPDMQIADFLRTGQIQQWNQSSNRLIYLFKAIGVSPSDLGAFGVPYTPVLEQGAPVYTINYTKELIETELYSKYGSDIQVLKLDISVELKDELKRLNLIDDATVLDRVGVLVTMNNAKAYCDNVASILSKYVKKTVELEISEPSADSNRNYQNVSNYSN